MNLRAYVPSAEDVLDRLPQPSRLTLPDESIIWKGQLGPFAYSLRGETLRLRGCLATYAAGAAPSMVAHVAAERLSDRLGFDVGTADVTRIEVFADLHLSRPVCLYLPLLVTLPRHSRLTFESASGGAETLKFITARRSLQFYDKGVQSGCSVPGGLLRVELSYRNGGVSEQLGKGLTLAAIGGEAFRSQIAGEWSDWYRKVEKGRELRTDLGARDFIRSLAVEQIYHKGISKVLAEIAAHRKGGVISRSTASDRRRDVLSLAQNPKFTAPSPLLAELEAAVAEAALWMRT